MHRICLIAILSLALISIHCQKEISISKTVKTSDPVTAIVQGNVFDENNNPVAGVTITAGAKTAVTDAKGYFRIRNASLDKINSLVTAQKPGYYKAFRVFSASAAVNQVMIKMIPRSITGTINSSDGGDITLADGSRIRFSANSFEKTTGGSYSGQVKVYAAFIDPTSPDISRLVPGSFLADDKDNNRVILKSYGMMAVELETASGERLNLAAGKTARLTFKIPAGLQASAPSGMPLWYLDEQTGLWKEEGKAVKNGNTYEGTVTHFSYWNCDVPGPTVNVTATFVNQDGQPIPYAYVTFTPPGSSYSAHGYADSLGQINGPIPANMNLILEVRNICHNVVYSQNVGPFSTNVNLGTITVTSPQYLITVNGRLLNCNANPVTSGYAIITHNNIVYYASVNSSGNFSVTLLPCVPFQNCTIVGVDNQAAQQGSPVTIPLTIPVTSAGDINSCGISILQFFDYTLDGVNTHLDNTIPGDYFNAMDSTSGNLTLTGFRAPSNIVVIDFITNAMPGTFALDAIRINQYNNNTVLPASNVILTNYATVPGNYFEGRFSGQFKDALNVTHSVSGTFRIRR